MQLQGTIVNQQLSSTSDGEKFGVVVNTLALTNGSNFTFTSPVGQFTIGQIVQITLQ